MVACFQWCISTLSILLHGLLASSSNMKTDRTEAQEPENTNSAYQDDLRFTELVDETLKRLEKDKTSSVHDKILAVNELHKRRYKIKTTDTEQTNIPISVGEKILENNLEKGVEIFEGDIVLDKEERDELFGKSSDYTKRGNVLRNRKYLWQSRKIPYVIAPVLSNIRGMIKAALQRIEKVSCLRFYEISRTTRNTNFIYYLKKGGCWSKIGKLYHKKSPQHLSLGDGCQNEGTIVHETLHALGFWHEQNRADRKKYVKVLWDNIVKGDESQFSRLVHPAYWDHLGVAYDYKSIMHYGRKSFSANGEPTLVSLDDPKAPLGATDKPPYLTNTDVVSLNTLYDCVNSPVGHRGWSSWTCWTPCHWLSKTKCSKYRQRYCINAPNDALKKRYCPGIQSYGKMNQYRDCALSRCKIQDGNWDHWGHWTTCTKTCGQGTRTRTRKCDDPTPTPWGGKPCDGSNKQTMSCTVGKCILGYYETQFDSGTGQWKLKPGLNTWEIWSNYWIPGPKHEHTGNKGKYLIARAWNTKPGGQLRTASLQSPIMNGNPKCMMFYYNIGGPFAVALAVRITNYHDTKKSWYLTYLTGPRDREWHRGLAQIDVPGWTVMISFEALVKDGAKGAIAIDDIYFIRGKCPASKPTAKPTPAPCIDINESCRHWASIGECDKNPKYMKKFCRKSCVCQPVGCKNKHSRCKEWAERGECKKNPAYMLQNCCLACKSTMALLVAN